MSPKPLEESFLKTGNTKTKTGETVYINGLINKKEINTKAISAMIRVLESSSSRLKILINKSNKTIVKPQLNQKEKSCN